MNLWAKENLLLWVQLRTIVKDWIGSLSNQIIYYFLIHNYIRNGNIPTIENFDYDYTATKEYKYGYVSYKVYLDDATFRRFNSTFNITERIKYQLCYNSIIYFY